MKNFLLNLRNTLLNLDEFDIAGSLILLFITLVIISYTTSEKDLICFDKKQLTEIEKTLKTNKLLRGTYNDV